MPICPLIADNDKGLSTLLEIKCSEGLPQSIIAWRFLLIDRESLIAVGIEYSNLRSRASILARCVSNAYDILSGRNLRAFKGNGFLSPFLVAIVQIPAAHVIGYRARIIPFSDLLCFCVVNNNTGKLLNRENGGLATLRRQCPFKGRYLLLKTC